MSHALDDAYYEQDDLWGNPDIVNTQRETVRIQKTSSIIPDDVRSILDVGAGDGRLCLYIDKTMSNIHRIVALDRSEKALSHINIEKIRASCDSIPFDDGSFDAVTCCEVLEHLPYSIYSDTISELQRVARKYIIVSVPNNESLTRSFIECPHCHCVFHKARHIRSFDKPSLRGVFGDFATLTIQPIGPFTKYYPMWALDLAEFLGLSNKPSAIFAICPQCGFDNFHTPRKSPTGENKNQLKLTHPIRLGRFVVPTKQKQPWLLALYERSNSSRLI